MPKTLDGGGACYYEMAGGASDGRGITDNRDGSTDNGGRHNGSQGAAQPTAEADQQTLDCARAGAVL